MPDHSIREIQLGGKQLVFLFMASLVLAVAIFLLGISVGRGVRSASDEPAASAEVAVAGGDVVPPAVMPPATQTTPADLQYHDQLQGQTPSVAEPAAASATKSTEPPAPVSEIPPGGSSAPVPKPMAAVATPAKPAAPPKAAEAVTANAVDKPVSKTQEKALDKPGVAGAAYFVQVDSFRSKANADKQAATLKGKGFAATVTSSGSLFRVRIGPFADRAEAERIRLRLQREEGLKPSIQH